MREPQVIYEAIQELQRRQQAEAATRQQAAIATNRSDIFRHAQDPVGGSPDGRVTLVEFFDYRCGYCRSMAGELRDMVATDRDLRFVFKELPVLGPESLVAARAGLAASRLDPVRYVDFHFALMQSKELTEEAILDLASGHGFDPEALGREMDAPWVKAHIEETRALADKLGITGTPSFVIGDTLIPGAVAVAELAAKVAEERGRAN
jgi:protein-disulfide isomerase